MPELNSERIGKGFFGEDRIEARLWCRWSLDAGSILPLKAPCELAHVAFGVDSEHYRRMANTSIEYQLLISVSVRGRTTRPFKFDGFSRTTLAIL